MTNQSQVDVAEDTSSDDPAALIRSNKACKLLDLTPMSVFRYEKDPDLDFPKPIWIGRTKFFVRREIIDWYRARQARSTELANVAARQNHHSVRVAHAARRAQRGSR